jgi:hypothetical protein
MVMLPTVVVKLYSSPTLLPVTKSMADRDKDSLPQLRWQPLSGHAPAFQNCTATADRVQTVAVCMLLCVSQASTTVPVTAEPVGQVYVGGSQSHEQSEPRPLPTQ